MDLNPSKALYLAGLLHDIGKFGQRAANSIQDLKTDTRNLSDQLQPTYKGKTGYYHVLWTSEFWTQIPGLPQTVTIDGKEHNLSMIAARHHRSIDDLAGNTYERIIAFADRLSSGQDRSDDLTIRDDESLAETQGKEAYKKRRLRSIFDALFHYEEELKQRPSSWHPLGVLQADESIFPKMGAKEHEYHDSQKAAYKILWDAFIAECNQLLRPITDTDAYLSTLYQLLRKYTWSIPSSTWNDRCDISLFDHSRTVAAIAACLYESIELQGALPKTTDGLYQEDVPRFSLVTGDLSGIQKFIYQINSKNAAKTLKGRSFFVQLFAESVVQKILSIYDQPEAHVLFSSGGRFQMILPNDADKWQQCLHALDRINHELLDSYDGALYIAAGKKDFSAQSFRTKNGSGNSIAEMAQDAQKELEKEKRQKYKRLINPAFFEPKDLVSTLNKVCMATGMDLPDDAKNRADKGDEPSYLHPSVLKQQKLGTSLRNASYILEYHQKPHLKNAISIFDGSFYYAAIEHEDLTQALLNSYKDGLRRIIQLNDTRFETLAALNRPSSTALSFMWYGGAWNPTVIDEDTGENRTAEFTDIAHDGVMNQLGILRMDVDNLGSSFRKGFGDPYGTADSPQLGSISRIATLSSMMDWFFSGYMNHLITDLLEKHYKDEYISGDFNNSEEAFGHIKNHVYPVYAGGDDLFIVARWDVAIELAHAIKDRFSRFTSNHPRLTISGGISCVNPKFPIHKAAELAAIAEEHAKSLPSYRKNSSTGSIEVDQPKAKHAFCLFDTPVGWDDWDHVVRPFIKDMLDLQQQMGSRALTNLFRQISAEYYGNSLAETGTLQGNPFGSWRWRTAYKVKRLIKQYKSSGEEVEQTLEELGGLAGALFTGAYKGISPKRSPQQELIDIIPLASRWIQNITRHSRNHSQQTNEVQH